jgi:hypothetical protein
MSLISKSARVLANHNPRGERRQAVDSVFQETQLNCGSAREKILGKPTRHGDLPTAL